MADDRRGMGRGLAAILPRAQAGGEGLREIPVELVGPNPRQPRRRFDHESTSALADSIRTQGVITPLLVRPRPAGGYELIAGERRWRAAREAGVSTLPALVREAADRDALLLGLVENVAREELSPVELGTNRATTDTRSVEGFRTIRSVRQKLPKPPGNRPTAGITSFCLNDARTTPHSWTTSPPPPP